jgi:hypothetical protein
LKLRARFSHMMCALLLATAFALPASAQNFPFPVPSRGGSSIGIGDVINIIGSGRNGSILGGSNSRQDRATAVIGLAGVLYDLSRQGQRQPASYPETYPGNYPGNYPGQPGYYPDPGGGAYYPNSGSYPGTYPGTAVNRPDGYSYIEHHGNPIRLDPRILPLTINAGGGNGDQVVGRAIQNWNAAGIGQVFALTNGPADLTIDWSGSKVSQGARAETRMIRSQNYVMPVELSVRTSGRTPDQLARVMTHELGHVLGLDHSRDRRDVMYEAEQNGSATLSARDLAMVSWLYSQNRYTPVVGRTDVNGGSTPVANMWGSHSLELGESTSMCSLHDH